MAIDSAHKRWLEAYEVGGSWRFKVYHYDAAGKNELIDHVGNRCHDSKSAAIEAGCEWCEENGVEAETMF